jgi:benzoylformate decarboxylase
VGSLLRPKELLQAREDHAQGRIDAGELRAAEDEAIREAVRKQQETGLQSATDGEFRRESWHMDFIYQLDGISKEAGHIEVKFFNEEGTVEFTPAALHVDGKLGVSETIFGEAFGYLRDAVTRVVPKLTIPSPSMVHYRGGKAAIDPAVYSDLDEFWADLTAAYREELRRLGELGCTYLQFDDTSLAYMNDPHQREYIASIGGDPERQHVEYIHHINEALAERPEGMSVTTHMCRGNFRSSWAAEGSYDFVAEALFSELEVDGLFMEWDDERSGGFEPLRLLPQGREAGRARARHDEARPARVEGRAPEADRGGVSVRADRATLPLPAVRLLVHGRGKRPHAGRAVGEAAPDRGRRAGSLGLSRTVREAAFEVFRRRGLTTLFANPGSTEVPFLAGLPDDLRFVLALHEGPVVALATGFAIGRGEPALAVVHTTAGLGNAVGAIATARVNRAPLVVLVGQQDRRHVAFEPFLTGRLAGLAGDYPVWVDQPVRAQDVPGAIDRAYHEAATRRGPALVIVSMDDWSAPADEEREDAAAGRVVRAAQVDPTAVEELAAFLADAPAPAIVVGAGADDPETWSALVQLAERLVTPVFQESFGARAGFPQDHALFAGVLPADRPRLREKLAPYDSLLVVGAPVFRQSPYAPGLFTEPGTRIAVVGDHPDEVHRSPAELAVLAPPAAVCRALAARVPAREASPPEPFRAPPAPEPPAPGEPLRAGHVLAALAERLPRETVVVEEAPVDRPELHDRLLAREPLGFLSAAMGGLGFALGGASGVRMALPERPVVAVVGDGSAMYGIQALWSAAHYGVGVLFVILSNGGYAIMDRLAERLDADGPWPGFDVDIAALARAQGCAAERITEHRALLEALDEAVPTLGTRTEPLLLDVVIAPAETFAP